MIVLLCRDLSCRVISILVLSNLTLCCLVLSFRFRSLLFLPWRDLSSRVFSILALSYPAIGCLSILPCLALGQSRTLPLIDNLTQILTSTFTLPRSPTNPITLGRKPCWEVWIYALKTKIMCFTPHRNMTLYDIFSALGTRTYCLMTYTDGYWKQKVLL